MNKTHPLKVLRFCPKCGSSHFKKSDTKSLKCGRCGFHLFFNSSAAVAGLIADSNGKLMLVKRGIEPNYGKYDLPGGFVDPGETAEQAIIRELFEELGLKVKKLQYLESATNEYIYSGFSVFTLDLAFRVYPETLSNLKPMDDILDYDFLHVNDIDFNNIPAPSIKQFVKKFFEK